MTDYFLSNGSKADGPYSAKVLATMELEPETAVRRGGEGNWVMAADDPDLKEIFVQKAAPARMSRSAAFELDEDISVSRGMHWGPLKDNDVKTPGTRTYAAVLWGIPPGQSWENACAAMPHTIKGHYFARPTRCINTGTNMWGEWDVPDDASSDNLNALITLLPNEPVELGHVGWGFRIDNSKWCYGATEIGGTVFVQPGDFNGVNFELGSKEQMMHYFRSGNRASGRRYFPYYSYKGVTAANPNPARAQAYAEQLKGAGYAIVGNNCMTHAMNIVNNYAGYPILPLILHAIQNAPRAWFTTIMAKEYSMNEDFWN